MPNLASESYEHMFYVVETVTFFGAIRWPLILVDSLPLLLLQLTGKVVEFVLSGHDICYLLSTVDCCK